MEKVTPEPRIAYLQDHLNATLEAVIRLRRSVEDLTKQAESGELTQIDTVAGELRKLPSMVALCLKTEASLATEQNKCAGIVQGGYALDLQQQRAEIGRKLDQLRRAGGSGAISE